MKKQVKSCLRKLMAVMLSILLVMPVFTGIAQAKQTSDDFIIENGVLTEYRGKGFQVTIPDGVVSIGNNVFYKCQSLTSVKIPKSVKSIGNNAFCDCISLTKVTMGNGVETIGADAFGYCMSPECVTIPDVEIDIDTNAFRGCYFIHTVSAPNRYMKLFPELELDDSNEIGEYE